VVPAADPGSPDRLGAQQRPALRAGPIRGGSGAPRLRAGRLGRGPRLRPAALVGAGGTVGAAQRAPRPHDRADPSRSARDSVPHRRQQLPHPRMDRPRLPEAHAASPAADPRSGCGGGEAVPAVCVIAAPRCRRSRSAGPRPMGEPMSGKRLLGRRGFVAFLAGAVAVDRRSARAQEGGSHLRAAEFETLLSRVTEVAQKIGDSCCFDGAAPIRLSPRRIHPLVRRIRLRPRPSHHPLRPHQGEVLPLLPHSSA